MGRNHWKAVLKFFPKLFPLRSKQKKRIKKFWLITFQSSSSLSSPLSSSSSSPSSSSLSSLSLLSFFFDVWKMWRLTKSWDLKRRDRRWFVSWQRIKRKFHRQILFPFVFRDFSLSLLSLAEVQSVLLVNFTLTNQRFEKLHSSWWAMFFCTTQYISCGWNRFL